ncbi:hypothetical protein T4B_9037 [Trichinella pseudospiralis]|uniref:Uncharacterized protein n=2 Tax=Trichinella pseudospiralis TaxID=6337 RepID=A0A0V1FXL9_TRIPS|nr:hypothetical protein T4D_7680 [Trichinella pseudospiralis]KRZ28325.1 hypothetical protein T4B_9037 [Trichinella pseudospiralis]KRZ38823.1 hypothetical protein T4C_5293 [Trichinella pseudospiralis]
MDGSRRTEKTGYKSIGHSLWKIFVFMVILGGNQATHLSLTDSLHELKASFGSTNSKLTKRIEPIAQGDLKPAYWLSKQ